MSTGVGSTPRVSDEVWEAIRPEADRIDARERRALRAAALAVAGAVVLAVAAWWSGVPQPRLAHGNSSGMQTDSSRRSGEYEFDLVNRGLLPITVSALAVEVPGAVTTSVTPSSFRLAGGASHAVRLRLHLEDCTAAVHAVRTGPEGWEPALGARVRRPWGTVHATVAPSGAWMLADLVLSACGIEPTD